MGRYATEKAKFEGDNSAGVKGERELGPGNIDVVRYYTVERKS